MVDKQKICSIIKSNFELLSYRHTGRKGINMNTKIIYTWTNNYDESQPYNGFAEETDYIITDGIYEFDDYLSDNDAQFEIENDIYYIIDDNGDRTGEAYMIVDELETEEEIDG